MNAVQPLQPQPARSIPGRDRGTNADLVTPPGGDAGRGARPGAPPVTAAVAKPRQQYLDMKASIHRKLLNRLNLEALASTDRSRAEGDIRTLLFELLGEESQPLTMAEREQILSDILDEVFGLGPLEPLLRDPTITEVMVNAWDRVYFERNGIIHRADTAFRDDSHVLNIIDKILRPVSRRLDDSSPMVDARLPDGSRVNAVIPPLAVHGPSLTIRKFSRELLAADDLVRLGTLGRSTLDFLSACVRARANILVAGGTGTGKTTLLNLLSAFIPPHERIVTIEDPAELQVKHEDWVSLETRPPNIEGKGQVLQRDLVKNALRMRPDRIIVGECRGGEAFDMLQAMNTGHDGSLTTIHANSPRDALSRIENMVLMAVELPVSAIREQIASGINLLVHLSRLQDGSRRVTHVTEIVGMQGGVISMHDIFEFVGRGVDGHGQIVGQLQPTGLRPHVLDRLAQYGEHVPIEWFLPLAGPSTPDARGA
jgi:pilus assembly protein CpaF